MPDPNMSDELRALSVMPDVTDEMAAEAGARGIAPEAVLRIFDDAGEFVEDVRYLVYADGTVTVLTDGWQPVIEDGRLYTFARVTSA